jgi:REP element-mobilizing transposase RayT
MPNHVHLVFRLLALNKDKSEDDFPVTTLLQSLKHYTAFESNKILDRSGQFWQHESFDHVVRNNEELENTIKYVIYNPVKARLAKNWEDWPYTYCKPKFAITFKEL